MSRRCILVSLVTATLLGVVATRIPTGLAAREVRAGEPSASDGWAGHAASPAAADQLHWSFRPVETPPLPTVRDETWARDDLDRFVLRRLEERGLAPNPEADRYTLLRRVAFDLTGLPPTEKEIRRFVDDPRSTDEALPAVVDRYLASRHFGERWGRHWLDVVHYADSVGRTWSAPFTYAWRYRDWVIDALNEDLPYDEFVTRQLAGDLVPADSFAEERRNRIATGFLALASLELHESESEQFRLDRIDDQIDVTTRAFLGLTTACARCHDHPYDPATMHDYYALAGVFASSETFSGQRRGEYVAADRLLTLPDEDGRIVPPDPDGVHSMSDIRRRQNSIGYEEVLYSFDPNLAMGVVEGSPGDLEIRNGGLPYDRGAAPPRGDLHLAGWPPLPDVPADASGRLQLARWIASPRHPLTARVMVNRVWQHLLGRGLVRTVDNFGLVGEEPSHPAVLDHLAARFSADGWSTKRLIRTIVLSRTYRASSAGHAANTAIDPGNELHWRANVRRLEVEALRDSLLDVAGRLEIDRPEGINVAGTGGKGRWGVTRSLLGVESPYRTVYLPVLRSQLPDLYTTFDFPDPSQIQGQREVTTVAPQALFLLNGDLTVDCARDAARIVLDGEATTDAARGQAAYLRILGRPATDDEERDAVAFLAALDPEGSQRDPVLYRWTALVQALLATAEFRSVL
jgi:hypothetical protein